jgi:hypothetical protein
MNIYCFFFCLKIQQHQRDKKKYVINYFLMMQINGYNIKSYEINKQKKLFLFFK